MAIDVTDEYDRATQVEIVVRRDTVEWWAQQHCQAVMRRDLLTAWLANPRGFFEADAVALGRTSHGYFIAVEGMTGWSRVSLDDLSRLWELIADHTVGVLPRA